MKKLKDHKESDHRQIHDQFQELVSEILVDEQLLNQDKYHGDFGDSIYGEIYVS